MSHKCHAVGCAEPVPPKMLMCKRHWGMVPQHIRVAVVVNFNSDQCSGKVRPTKTWLKYARAAIDSVRKQENSDD